MAEWLNQESYRSKAVRWHADYCCRDDFGAGIDRVSAWAGLHYFASRNARIANGSSHSVLTWPEGNGWLVNRMREPFRNRVNASSMAIRVRNAPGGVEVESLDPRTGVVTLWKCKAAIVAAPQFVARRIVEDFPVARFEGRPLPVYAPWMVANVSVDSLRDSVGADPAWDNVIYGSRSLGYVVATHQNIHPFPGSSVLTYYHPLDELEPLKARELALSRDWGAWRDLIFDHLKPAHPNLSDFVRNIDVMIWGHGMICPTPGYLWNSGRAKLAEPAGAIHFAHSDLSGISLFEEAYTRGLQAADAVLAEIGDRTVATTHFSDAACAQTL